MARRRRHDRTDSALEIAKIVFLGMVVLALAAGGLSGFGKALRDWTSIGLLVSGAILALAALFLLGWVVLRWRRRTTGPSEPTPPSGGNFHPPPPHLTGFTGDTAPSVLAATVDRTWTPSRIETALGEIDWYQFEKYCAALLRHEGYGVERKGGAQPDGGVDLIATREGETMLVQCKHWRTWVVQEKVVREMLGSMAHFQVVRGFIYTLKGWTRPAAEFAQQHQISLADAGELARRGASLPADQLDACLKPDIRHCPKCEAEMILRTGNFTSFWGCSNFPRCRGKLNHDGAR